jgi:hypothetical protein
MSGPGASCTFTCIPDFHFIFTEPLTPFFDAQRVPVPGDSPLSATYFEVPVGASQSLHANSEITVNLVMATHASLLTLTSYSKQHDT